MSKPINFDKTLERELKAVRRTCDAIKGGRTKLAKFLGIRPAEVTRYLKGGRKPGGDVLLGMQEFVRRNAAVVGRGFNIPLWHNIKPTTKGTK